MNLLAKREICDKEKIHGRQVADGRARAALGKCAIATLIISLFMLRYMRGQVPHKGQVQSYEGCQSPAFAEASIRRDCSSPLSLPCFDRGRCDPRKLSAYVYDNYCSLKASSELLRGPRGNNHPDVPWRMALLDRGGLAETPEEACVCIYVIDRRDLNLCVQDTEFWNDGMNHLIVSDHDKSRIHFPHLANSKAMFAESHAISCFHRAGYDISIPLQAKALFPEFQSIPPHSRKYFLTYRGTTKLDGPGSFRRGLDELDDPDNGVVIVSQCNSRAFQEFPEEREYCESILSRYKETNYQDLMDTTFALIPGGRQPATYRLGEAIAAGAIPVWWGYSYILPFATEGGIDWSTCAFSFPVESLHEIVPTLRQISEIQMLQMQQGCFRIFREVFEWEDGSNPWDGIIRKTLSILDNRLAFVSS